MMEGLTGHSLPLPLRPEPARPPELEVVQEPVCFPKQTDSTVQAACPPAPKCQPSQDSELLDDIPPEAVEEYIDIMDWLEEHNLLVMEEPRTFIVSSSDLGRSHYQSPISGRSRIYRHRERHCLGCKTGARGRTYTPEQLVEKRLVGSKDKGGVCRPRSRGALQSDAHQSAEQDGCDPKQMVNKKTCSTPKASQVLKRVGATE
ncbi:uncharacterized protein LOC111812355 [Octodon degus]|uniref:Uncharacterized protein LOC111812355 n=1 Tax=Octodon degus TaxID=10160 RepID=A0A6P6D720_OCTDE|nr:uncharacterized protein LOC111812355 [Octodon degus]